MLPQFRVPDRKAFNFQFTQTPRHQPGFVFGLGKFSRLEAPNRDVVRFGRAYRVFWATSRSRNSTRA